MGVLLGSMSFGPQGGMLQDCENTIWLEILVDYNYKTAAVGFIAKAQTLTINWISR